MHFCGLAVRGGGRCALLRGNCPLARVGGIQCPDCGLDPALGITGRDEETALSALNKDAFAGWRQFSFATNAKPAPGRMNHRGSDAGARGAQGQHDFCKKTRKITLTLYGHIRQIVGAGRKATTYSVRAPGRDRTPKHNPDVPGCHSCAVLLGAGAGGVPANGRGLTKPRGR